MTVEIIHADARHLPIADECVQCIVTSPPYWGLRKYAGNQEFIWDSPIVAPSDAMLCAAAGHVWVEESQTVEIRTGLGLKELSKRYRGGGKQNGEIKPFTVHRGSC